MPYPSDFQESFAKLETSRSFRKKQTIKRLTDQERTELIEAFHPDYRDEGMEELKVGVNKGQRVPLEFARVVESYSQVNPDKIDLENPDYCVDILVVGGGGGGSAATLTAHSMGADVLLATKLRLGDANTLMAEGGICAPLRPGDDPYKHFLDTLGGGHYTNVPEIVKALVLDGPKTVNWLIDLGVMFDFEEDGTLKVNHCGGHSRKRLLSCKDLTGLELMRVLRDEIKNREIPYLEFSPAVEIILDTEGRCSGAILYNMETEEYYVVKANAVILASGGIGRLHVQSFPTTNHYGATADGLVIGYRAGAELLHMDSIQYHPTGVVWPEQLLGQLITEVMRGHGTHLVNVDGERFINELECRDTCASALIRECVDRGKGVVTPTGMVGIWMDTPLVEGVEKHFVGIYQRFKKYDIDISKEPILIFPTQHYQNGGLKINPHGETTIPGLFAAGEVSGGVQGKNRLAGNSLLDIFVFGRRSALRAVELMGENKSKLTLEHVIDYQNRLKEIGIEENRKSPILLPDYARDETKAKRA